MTFHETGLPPAIIVAAFALLTAPASASSFMALGSAPPAPSPSIITMGEPVAPTVEARLVSGDPASDTAPAIYRIAPSVIAFGAEAIPKSPEQVAAIGRRQAARHFSTDAFPMVIRGGVIGDAFIAQAAPATTAAQPQDRPADMADAEAGTPPQADRPASPTLEAR